jgi:hypothetical protein
MKKHQLDIEDPTSSKKPKINIITIKVTFPPTPSCPASLFTVPVVGNILDTMSNAIPREYTHADMNHIWIWDTKENGAWSAYTLSESRIIEERYCSRKITGDSFKLNPSYIIDFNLMKQKRVGDMNKTRRIKRISLIKIEEPRNRVMLSLIGNGNLMNEFK